MIKANELRIGNWIGSADGLGKVTEIYGDGCATNANNLWLPSEAYGSINLTPGLLEKAGFRKDYCGDDSDGIFVWRLELTDGEFVLSSDFVLCSTDTLCPVSSLHQLQNLYFALTGTELNIML